MEENKEVTVDETVQNEEVVEENKGFEPITSQEQLNKVIGVRLEKAKEQARKEFADYDDLKAQVEAFNNKESDLQKQIDAYKESDKTISELKDKLKATESYSLKMETAYKFGLPFEMADRLRGETKEEIEKDCKALLSVVGTTTTRKQSPSRNQEAGDIDGVTKSFMELNPKIKV